MNKKNGYLTSEEELAIIEEYKTTKNSKVLEPIFTYLDRLFRLKLKSKSAMMVGLDVDDVVQELLLQSFNSLELFDTTRGVRFVTYIASDSTIHNKVYSIKHRHVRHASRYDHELYTGEDRSGYYNFHEAVEQVANSAIRPDEAVELEEMLAGVEEQTQPAMLAVMVKELLGMNSNTMRYSQPSLQYMTRRFRGSFDKYL